MKLTKEEESMLHQVIVETVAEFTSPYQTVQELHKAVVSFIQALRPSSNTEIEERLAEIEYIQKAMDNVIDNKIMLELRQLNGRMDELKGIRQEVRSIQQRLDAVSMALHSNINGGRWNEAD